MGFFHSLEERTKYSADVGLLSHSGDPVHVVLPHRGVVLVGSEGHVSEPLFHGTAQELGDGAGYLEQALHIVVVSGRSIYVLGGGLPLLGVQVVDEHFLDDRDAVVTVFRNCSEVYI